MARIKGPRKVHRYSAEFKVKAVNLSDLAGVQVKDVAEALDIHPFMLSRWRKEVRDGRLRSAGRVKLKARERREIEQLSALKRKYALLWEEHELLKKAIRFCSARRPRSSPSSTPSRTVLGLTTTAPGQIWVGDVTYLRSAGRWRYLAVVLDRHSRRVLGWSLRLRRDLTLTRVALNRAVLGQRPQPGLILHSDRGVEYSAYVFRARLAALGITQSMKCPREICDNAFVESFFHSLKADVIHGYTFDDDRSLNLVVRRYVRRYNHTRLHSSLGFRSPINYERNAA